MRTLFLLAIGLLSASFCIQPQRTTVDIFFPCNGITMNLETTMFSEDECITGSLDHIAGDTYAIRFFNKCESGYKVFYQVIDKDKFDKDKVIQETTSCYLRSKSGNSSGTIHCSPQAYIKIIRKEIF